MNAFREENRSGRTRLLHPRQHPVPQLGSEKGPHLRRIEQLRADKHRFHREVVHSPQPPSLQRVIETPMGEVTGGGRFDLVERSLICGAVQELQRSCLDTSRGGRDGQVSFPPDPKAEGPCSAPEVPVLPGQIRALPTGTSTTGLDEGSAGGVARALYRAVEAVEVDDAEKPLHTFDEGTDRSEHRSRARVSALEVGTERAHTSHGGGLRAFAPFQPPWEPVARDDRVRVGR